MAGGDASTAAGAATTRATEINSGQVTNKSKKTRISESEVYELPLVMMKLLMANALSIRILRSVIHKQWKVPVGITIISKGFAVTSEYAT